MAKKKSASSIKNGRDSHSKRLGIKKYQGQYITNGGIICRQKGSNFKNGCNTGIGRDYTIYSKINGIVYYNYNTIFVL